MIENRSLKIVFTSKTVANIYSGKLAKKYDTSSPPFFERYKRLAFNDSSLKNGDRVLVFCCGTGLDFSHILRKIGKEGVIVGVDFSNVMLEKAQDKIRRNGWDNVQLIEADITRPIDGLDEKFDVGVCTLGLSIIPEFKVAYYNLLSHIKKNGQIIIGDMQLASGFHANFNRLTLFLAKKYGGTYEGHQNSIELCKMMETELTKVRKREFFFNSYYYCIGTIE